MFSKNLQETWFSLTQKKTPCDAAAAREQRTAHGVSPTSSPSTSAWDKHAWMHDDSQLDASRVACSAPSMLTLALVLPPALVAMSSWSDSRLINAFAARLGFSHKPFRVNAVGGGVMAVHSALLVVIFVSMLTPDVVAARAIVVALLYQLAAAANPAKAADKTMSFILLFVGAAGCVPAVWGSWLSYVLSAGSLLCHAFSITISPDTGSFFLAPAERRCDHVLTRRPRGRFHRHVFNAAHKCAATTAGNHARNSLTRSLFRGPPVGDGDIRRAARAPLHAAAAQQRWLCRSPRHPAFKVRSL